MTVIITFLRDNTVWADWVILIPATVVLIVGTAIITRLRKGGYMR